MAIFSNLFKKEDQAQIESDRISIHLGSGNQNMSLNKYDNGGWRMELIVSKGLGCGRFFAARAVKSTLSYCGGRARGVPFRHISKADAGATPYSVKSMVLSMDQSWSFNEASV